MDAQLTPPRGLESLAPPPRSVPLDIKLDELFGGSFAFIGWIFILVGLPFAYVFALNADFSGWRYQGALEYATARASACRGTHFSEGGSKHSRGHPIYETEFFFQSGGATIVGSSYGQGCYQAGQDAPVEFPPGRPELARVRGLRRAPMPPSAAFVLIFPLLGALFVLLALRRGLREIRLLERGVLARGKSVGKRMTGTRTNNRPEWEVELAFKDAFGAERSCKARTYEPEKLETDGVHNVFYDPDRPDDSISAEALPEPLFSDYSGGLSSDGWGRVARALALPALVVIANAAFWYWRLSAR